MLQLLWVPGEALGCMEGLHAKAIPFVSAWLPALVDPQEKRRSLGRDGSEVGLPQEEDSIAQDRPQGGTCICSSPLTSCTLQL